MFDGRIGIGGVVRRRQTGIGETLVEAFDDAHLGLQALHARLEVVQKVLILELHLGHVRSEQKATK